VPLLEIRNLRAAFPGPGGPVEAVRGIDLTLEEGEVLGIVGESGSGKSVAMMAVLQLLPAAATVSGSARFKGRELVGMPRHQIRQILGKDIGCIFQDPLSAFNPVVTIGAQIVEAIRLHDRRISRRSAQDRTVELLASVSIPQPALRAKQYPHEFSGGMRQRAMIAMALANSPRLLIADEPTTALDVTVQAQILDLLRRLAQENGIGMVLITHDLGVVAGMARDIAVMYGGRVVEFGTAEEIFYDTCHPYTRGLIAAMPRLDRTGETLVSIDGTPPSIYARPPGCSFAPRCHMAAPACAVTDPVLRRVKSTLTACLRAQELADVSGTLAGPVKGRVTV
jgi:peptide/nickel transport system ATP-binding protein